MLLTGYMESGSLAIYTVSQEKRATLFSTININRQTFDRVIRKIIWCSFLPHMVCGMFHLNFSTKYISWDAKIGVNGRTAEWTADRRTQCPYPPMAGEDMKHPSLCEELHQRYWRIKLCYLISSLNRRASLNGS